MGKSDWYTRRWEILQRDNFTCRYCGQFAPNVVLEVDHVTPVCEGGDDSPDNLVTSCRSCNRGKEAYRARLLYAEQRKARASVPRSADAPTSATAITAWMRDQGRPVDKYEIIQGTGFSERMTAYTLAELREQGAIRYAGKRSRRILWECVPD